MRKVLLVFIAAAALAVAFQPAAATSPHFIGTPSLTQDGNSIVISFKAAGLGNVTEATFDLTGSVDVFSRCYNRGGNKPQADNKQETLIVNRTQTFPVRNGQTTGGFTITPLSTLTCPGNQVVVVESVTYDLTLSGMGISHHFTS